jgi:hypothetical protein
VGQANRWHSGGIGCLTVILVAFRGVVGFESYRGQVRLARQ